MVRYSRHFVNGFFIMSVLAVSALATPKLQDLDYSDSLDSLANPECGFYDAKVLRVMPDGTIPLYEKRWSTWGKIFQMRIDISQFSDNGCFKLDSDCEKTRPLTDECKATVATSNCKSQPLTQEVLDLLREYFEEARQQDRSLIVRLAYDTWYDGHSNAEPDQETILNHLKQIGPLYSEYSDVIVFVELGLYGRWGEMNGTIQGTNENIAEAMQVLLESSSPDIKTGPRRPDIVAAWMGLQTRNDKGWTSFTDFHTDSTKFKDMLQAKGDTVYRVGMYNDGYLGNDGDMGTIGYGDPGRMTREMLTEWLEDYGALHTPYGGELVYNSNSESRGPINTPRYLSYEGFRTHTSYLNRFHHKATIDAWNDSVFTARDSIDQEYDGKSGFLYVRNHLGYRYILRESIIEDTIAPGSDLNIKLKIQNVGFGNMTQRRSFNLVVDCEADDHYSITSPAKTIDPRDILSRKMTKDTVTTFDGINEIELTLPSRDTKDMKEGKCKLYVRIDMPYPDIYTPVNDYQCVRFGNTVAQYDSAKCGNYIGEFTVSKKAKQTTDAIAGTKTAGNLSFTLQGNRLQVHNATRVEIFDLIGNRVLTDTSPATTTQTLSLDYLRAGTFLIRLSDGTRQQTARIQLR